MKTVNAYQFHELPEAIQEKVLNDFNVDPLYDHDPILEGMREDLEAIGLEDVDIKYSGFWSQGDGLSFTGYVNDAALFLEHIGAPKCSDSLIEALDITFSRAGHRNVHERSVSTLVDYAYMTNEVLTEWNEKIEDLEKHIEDWRLKRCQSMYKILERYYDECTSRVHGWCTSREAIIEYMEANDYHFLEDGRPV